MPALSVQTTVNARPAKGIPGQLDGAYPHSVIIAQNGDSVSIPFGKAVAWDPTSPAHHISATLPVNQTDRIMGIVAYRGGYARAWTDSSGVVHGDLDNVGLTPGTTLNVVRQGRMLVTAASAVTPGDRLFIRRTAGIGESLGALEDAADSTDMIDSQNQGVWLSTAAAGELAWIEVDFVNSPT